MVGYSQKFRRLVYDLHVEGRITNEVSILRIMIPVLENQYT